MCILSGGLYLKGDVKIFILHCSPSLLFLSHQDVGRGGSSKGENGEKAIAKVTAWDSQKLSYMGATFFVMLLERRV